MQSLGVKLRLERERQRIAIDKIAEETCISQRYLEAIEADDQSSLPGEFFYRAFVRQYSKYLGWNPDEVEKQINEVSSLPVMEPVESPVAPGNSLNLQTDQQITALRQTLKDKPMRPPQNDGMSRAWIAFALVVIAVCGAYFTWRNFTPPAAVTAESKPPVVQPQVAAEPQTPPAQQTQSLPTETTTAVPANTTPAPVETIPVKSAPAQTPPATGTFALTIRAKETTWIRLTADGAKIYGGTLDAGQERSVNAASAELIVGNAGTLDVIYNGKPLTYGSKGEVKTLLVSPEGWKYKPKPLPEPSASPSGSTSGDSALGGPSPRAL